MFCVEGGDKIMTYSPKTAYNEKNLDNYFVDCIDF
jgi:hypothetical protein